MNTEVTVFWFRRDLRLEDNTGLDKALSGNRPVLPIFIFDTEILDELPRDDARVAFIFDCLNKISAKLEAYGSSVAMYYGSPEEVFERLMASHNVQEVITNHDYEPYARKRDEDIKNFLTKKHIQFHTCKDQVIFEKDEVLKSDGTPYVVYTPYSKAWKARLASEPLNTEQQPNYGNFIQNKNLQELSLEDMGFTRSSIKVPNYDLSEDIIRNYKERRDFPDQHGTSQLSPHLRFGAVSIRQLVRTLLPFEQDTLLNELIWREFFMQILWHFPRTVNSAFKPAYDRIEWRNNPDDFEAWKNGITGYPLVDAGMRQLNETGLMHNRVRMVVASFLCKHLLIDWRWGEAYFAEKLLDYEQSSNVGNWQWAAGSGVDAAPYFRIFNPTSQLQKFDSAQKYVRKWVPEFGSNSYPSPMVDHKVARERCLTAYRTAL